MLIRLLPCSCLLALCHCSGPVEQALPFFAGLGYACPERKDPGSFLQVKSYSLFAAAPCCCTVTCPHFPSLIMATRSGKLTAACPLAARLPAGDHNPGGPAGVCHA